MTDSTIVPCPSSTAVGRVPDARGAVPAGGDDVFDLSPYHAKLQGSERCRYFIFFVPRNWSLPPLPPPHPLDFRTTPHPPGGGTRATGHVMGGNHLDGRTVDRLFRPCFTVVSPLFPRSCTRRRAFPESRSRIQSHGNLDVKRALTPKSFFRHMLRNIY